jgi:hypothetical protein
MMMRRRRRRRTRSRRRMRMLGLQKQYLQSCYDFMIPSTSLITVHLGTALAKVHMCARMLPVVRAICEHCPTTTILSSVRHPVMHCVHWMLATSTACFNFGVRMKT